MNARFAEIIEHIERVLNHARSIEQQAESAAQLYFAAMSHRTTEIMRLLSRRFSCRLPALPAYSG
jgi:Mg2+ and Co2+ transporter CorA